MLICKRCGQETSSLHGVPKEFCRKCYKHLWYKNKVAGTPKQKVQRENTNFDGKRESILARDNYTCQECHKYFEDHSKLIVHHRDRLGRGSEVKNNADSNLVTVCRSCHCKEHHEDLMTAKRPLYNRWAVHYDCCVSCGTVSTPHGGKGLCKTCYSKKFPSSTSNRHRWSYKYEHCVLCGKNDTPHRGHGLCQVCYLKRYNETYVRKPTKSTK